MSQRFLDALAKAGCNLPVQASAIDWAFEDQSCAPLFAALTVNLTRDNILTDEERRRYVLLFPQCIFVTFWPGTLSCRRRIRCLLALTLLSHCGS